MCFWIGQYCQGRESHRKRADPTGGEPGDYQPEIEAWRVESEGQPSTSLYDNNDDVT
jgi:hypothetical protein